MRNFVLKHFRPIIFSGLACLAAALVLSSCAPKKPQEEIIGKWSVEGQSGTMEFRNDGTIVTTTDGKESSVTYKFLNETNLEMDTSAMVGTNKLFIRMPASIAFHDGAADLTITVPQKAGAASTPITMHLQRAK